MSAAPPGKAVTDKAAPSGLSARSGFVQRKLVVGASNDPLELEADRVADQVLAGPAEVAAPLVRRGSAPSSADARAAPDSVERALAGTGSPLEPMLRKDMEQRFGHDFSRVRVHSSAAARQSAAEIDARAYTVGQDIVFGASQYFPQSFTGRRLLAHELAHVVQQSPVGRPGTGAFADFRTLRRQAAAAPVGKQQANRKIARVERYWHSPSARVIFEDGSTEAVTFIDGAGLDMPAAPGQRYERVVDVTIDRTSPIRPHLELAAPGKGSRVPVETRLAPADRIARLPARARRQVADAFLDDTDNESDPQQMEFIADMGERSSEAPGDMAISVEGRDPATVSRMQAVDQWIAGQQDALDKIGGWRRGNFDRLLKDIRQIGVTGASASDDLQVQDIELVLAGVAGGQSDFLAFGEFKRILLWNVRAGNRSLAQEAADNPEFFIRNEYRKSWQAEAEGLRKLSRIAAAAQVAPFIAIGASAVIGSGAVGLEALGTGAFEFAAARGISAKLLTSWVGTSLFAASGVNHLVAAHDEAKAAGMDTGSPLAFANIFSTAVLRTFGVGEVVENVRNESILTHQDLGRTPFERIFGAGMGTLDALGATSMLVPESPTGANPASSSRGPNANAAPDLPASKAPTVAEPVVATAPPVVEPVATPTRVHVDEGIGVGPSMETEADASLPSGGAQSEGGFEFEGAKGEPKRPRISDEPEHEPDARTQKPANAREQAEIDEARDLASYRPRGRTAAREGSALGYSRPEIEQARSAIVQRKQIVEFEEVGHRGAESHQVPEPIVLSTINDPQAVMLSENGNWIFYRDGTIVVTKAESPGIVQTAFGRGGKIPTRYRNQIGEIYGDETLSVGSPEPAIKLDAWIAEQRGGNSIGAVKVWP